MGKDIVQPMRGFLSLASQRMAVYAESIHVAAMPYHGLYLPLWKYFCQGYKGVAKFIGRYFLHSVCGEIPRPVLAVCFLTANTKHRLPITCKEPLRVQSIGGKRWKLHSAHGVSIFSLCDFAISVY